MLYFCHACAVVYHWSPCLVVDGKAVSGYILYKSAGELLVSMATGDNTPYSSDVKLRNSPGWVYSLINLVNDYCRSC